MVYQLLLSARMASPQWITMYPADEWTIYWLCLLVPHLSTKMYLSAVDYVLPHPLSVLCLQGTFNGLKIYQPPPVTAQCWLSTSQYPLETMIMWCYGLPQPCVLTFCCIYSPIWLKPELIQWRLHPLCPHHLKIDPLQKSCCKFMAIGLEFTRGLMELTQRQWLEMRYKSLIKITKENTWHPD